MSRHTACEGHLLFTPTRVAQHKHIHTRMRTNTHIHTHLLECVCGREERLIPIRESQVACAPCHTHTQQPPLPRPSPPDVDCLKTTPLLRCTHCTFHCCGWCCPFALRLLCLRIRACQLAAAAGLDDGRLAARAVPACAARSVRPLVPRPQATANPPAARYDVQTIDLELRCGTLRWGVSCCILRGVAHTVYMNVIPYGMYLVRTVSLVQCLRNASSLPCPELCAPAALLARVVLAAQRWAGPRSAVRSATPLEAVSPRAGTDTTRGLCSATPRFAGGLARAR